MLQRLFLLGRVGRESTDRQFVDTYFLDGLRAEDVVREVFKGSDVITSEKWRNHLEPFGLRYIASEICFTPDLSDYVRIMRKAASGQNHILAGELLTCILSANEGTYDFANVRIRNRARISYRINYWYADGSHSSIHHDTYCA